MFSALSGFQFFQSYSFLQNQNSMCKTELLSYNNECMHNSSVLNSCIIQLLILIWFTDIQVKLYIVCKKVKYWGAFVDWLYVKSVKCVLVTITVAFHPNLVCIPSRPIIQIDIVNKYAGGWSLIFLKETHFLWRLWNIYPQYVLKLRLGVNDVGESFLMAYGWTLWNTDVYK